ncbi:MAG: FHA domain-containing protein [Caldilineaceae bacterium]|nr:FHA domain-containing protein [Caldilineaceae bacterium]
MKLYIKPPDSSERLVPINDIPFFIGRDPACSLILDSDLGVSGRHAQLICIGARVQLTDLGSTNGTYVNGARLASHAPHDIQPNDIIMIGKHRLSLAPQAVADQTLPHSSPAERPHDRRTVTDIVATAEQKLRSDRRLAIIILLLCGMLMGYVLFALLNYWLGASASGANNTLAGTVVAMATWTPTPRSLVAVEPTVPKNPESAVISTLIPVFTATPTPTATPRPQIYTAPATALPQQGAAVVNEEPSQPQLVASGISAQPGRIWDSRLDRLGVTMEPADVSPGQPYWRLIEARWLNEEQAGGRHHIYVEVLDENGVRQVGHPVTVFWDGGKHTGAVEDKSPPDLGFNFQMYASGYAYSVRVDELPGDIVKGMGMGSIADRFRSVHVAYELIFKKSYR